MVGLGLNDSLTREWMGKTFRAEGGPEWKHQTAYGSGNPQFLLGEGTSLKE